MVCPVCRHEPVKARDLASKEDTIISLYHCPRCLHNFQDPLAYQDIYSSGHFTEKARGEEKIPDNVKIKELDKKAWARFQFYQRYIAEWRQVLEIGSSIGSFLHLLKLYGKSVQGIEPDPHYCAFSSTQYHIAQESSLLENWQTEEKYDAICSFHVIEQVVDPKTFRDRIHDLCQEKGKVLVECPSWEVQSYGSRKHTVWQPQVQYFTLSSIYQLFSEKFKVLQVGFWGMALYLYAERSDHDTFEEKAFRKLKKRSRRVHGLTNWVPQFKLTSGSTPLSTTQLILQPFLQNTLGASLKKLKEVGSFAPQEFLYRKNEAGWSWGNKAVHLSYFSGWENAGDTVLSKCVRDSFRILNGVKRFRLRKVTASVTPNLIEEINRGPFLLIGGGGLLLPDSNPNNKSGWQWAASAEDIDRIKVPIVVYAIGYNYFPGQEPHELFKKSLAHIVDRASFFGLRNHGSINAVKSLIPEHLHHKLRWQPCPTTLVRHWEGSLPPKESTKNIGINVAYDRYRHRFGADMYIILDQMALALKDLAAKGYHIFNICHLKDDAKFEISLDKHEVPYQTLQLQFALPSKVYAIYNQMDLVMGLRGHAQMIPFGVNCKILSLGSHHKLRYFLEDIDALDWFVDLKSQTSTIRERIVNAFEHIYADTDNIQQRLIHQQQQLLEVTMENAQEIKEILKT